MIRKVREDTLIASSGAGVSAAELETPRIKAEIARTPARGNERWSVLRRWLAVADLTAASVAGIAGGLVTGLDLVAVVSFAVLVVVAWPLLAFVCGLYAGQGLRAWASGISEIPRIVIAVLLLSWPLFVAAKGLEADHPATGALAASLITGLLSITTRASARGIVHRSALLRQRTLIVGSGLVAALLVEKLRTHTEFGLEPVGILDDDPHQTGESFIPTLGRLDQLSLVIDTDRIDRVIIAFSRASHESLHEAIRVCRDRRVAVDIVPRLFEFLDGARALDQVGGLPLLSIGAHHLSHASSVAKRTLDVALSGLGLLVLTPVLLALSLAIKLESRGPVFFRQPRVGRSGAMFELLKFRSMWADAELRKREFDAVNDAGDGVMFKIHRDPRVTRVGRFLRRFSLDELPQLFNVFRGDMSLVGPRPLIQEEAGALGEAWHSRRLDLRPGMTGPWQVSGRSDIPFQEMIRFDYQYVAGWSLARDLEILLETVPAVLSGKGAY